MDPFRPRSSSCVLTSSSSSSSSSSSASSEIPPPSTQSSSHQLSSLTARTIMSATEGRPSSTDDYHYNYYYNKPVIGHPRSLANYPSGRNSALTCIPFNLGTSSLYAVKRSSFDLMDSESCPSPPIDKKMPTSPNGNIKVSWVNLTYSVEVSKADPRLVKAEVPVGGLGAFQKLSNGFRKNRTTILNGLSGQLKSGELTAILGPSGCGKTTLLECLAGKRQTGVSGDIFFSGCRDVKLSFIGQHDHLLSHLTVRESLMFASKLKNFRDEVTTSSSDDASSTKSDEDMGIFTLDIVPNDQIVSQSRKNSRKEKNRKKDKKVVKKSFDHESVVQKLMDQFSLNVCADVRVSNCSGGQLKRLSIAQELVSKPNLLILDEPTSGLDSASCYQAIELLQQLTMARNTDDHSEPLAVVATIHQPSARVFNMFRKVFFLSTTGKCIYEGSPADLVPMLSSVGLVCPSFTNPADYMLEIASGEYGIEYIHKLAAATDARNNLDRDHPACILPPDSTDVVVTVDKVIGGHEDKKKPQSLGHRTPSTLSTTTSMSSSCSSDIHFLHKRQKDRSHLPFFGHINLLLKRTVMSILRDPMLTATRFLSHVIVAVFIGLLYGSKIGTASGCPPAHSSIENVQLIQKHVYEDIVASSENVANLFFAAMFIMYGAMLPTVLTFPTELNVFLKERSNGWYHSRTYYLAKTMADVPMQLFFPAVYGIIIYLMTSQVWSVWRLSMFILVLILAALSAQSHGLLVSALFVHDPNVAVYAGPMTTIPFLLFAGFFVRIKTMPAYLVGVSYISYIRYAFEAMISVLYGFDRCHVTPLEVPTDPTGNSGSALFKFLSILFSPDYDQSGSSDYDDDIINGTVSSILDGPTPPSIGSVGSDGSFSPSKGLIESIVKDFQANNPFFGDVFNPDKNSTTSYVMKQFDLTDYSLYLNIFRLFVVFMVFRIGAYLLLLWKADRKR